MNGSSTRRAFLVGAGTTLLAGCTGLIGDKDGPDSPESLDSAWPQPGYDHRMRNYTPTAPGPRTEIDELWTVEGDTSYTPPVIADETLFVGSADGTVRAFDARNGEEQWTVSVGDSAGQPQVGEESLYVATDEATVALSVTDGEERWRIDTVPNIYGLAGSEGDTPSSNGLLYTPHGLYLAREAAEACPDDEDEFTCPAGAGGTGPTTAALVSRHDPEDGSILWEEPIVDPLSGHLFASETTLIVSSGSVGTAPWLLNPEGGRVTDEVARISHGPAEHCYSEGAVFGYDGWNGIYYRKEINGNSLRNAATESTPLSAGSLATDGERCYISSKQGHGTIGVACLSIDGEELWIHELDTVVGMPTVAGDVVCYRDEETLYCVDPTDGSEQWTHEASDMGSEFAVVDDILYTADDDTVRAFRAV